MDNNNPVMNWMKGIEDAFHCLPRPRCMKFKLSVDFETKRIITEFCKSIPAGIAIGGLQGGECDMIVTPGGFHIYLDLLAETNEQKDNKQLSYNPVNKNQ